MRTKLMALLGSVLLMLAAHSQSASAHVLVGDTTGKTGAILHITPADDPVAGGTTGIYFDARTKADLNQAALHLQITDDAGTIDESVLMEGKGTTAGGAFIFPVRGLYHLTFTVGSKVGGPKVEPLKFEYSLRITKSLYKADPKPTTPAWVTFGLILSVWGLAASLLSAFQRRKSIRKHSL